MFNGNGDAPGSHDGSDSEADTPERAAQVQPEASSNERDSNADDGAGGPSVDRGNGEVDAQGTAESAEEEEAVDMQVYTDADEAIVFQIRKRLRKQKVANQSKTTRSINGNVTNLEASELSEFLTAANLGPTGGHQKEFMDWCNMAKGGVLNGVKKTERRQSSDPSMSEAALRTRRRRRGSGGAPRRRRTSRREGGSQGHRERGRARGGELDGGFGEAAGSPTVATHDQAPAVPVPGASRATAARSRASQPPSPPPTAPSRPPRSPRCPPPQTPRTRASSAAGCCSPPTRPRRPPARRRPR